MTRAMVTFLSPIDGAPEMSAHAREAAESVTLTNEEDPFLFQESDRRLGKIIRLASFEKQARFVENVRDEKANGSERGGDHRKSSR